MSCRLCVSGMDRGSGTPPMWWAPRRPNSRAGPPPAGGGAARAPTLARMPALGLPVPPAFVLPVDLCAAIVSGEGRAMEKLSEGLAEGIEFLEATTGKKFGARRRPLLVSVRSGAARSMPGMLDTVLNVGCPMDAAHGLCGETGDARVC